jgi:hypothetical protein
MSWNKKNINSPPEPVKLSPHFFDFPFLEPGEEDGDDEDDDDGEDHAAEGWDCHRHHDVGSPAG